MRRSGIDIIGNIPWGTHFCQFYRTRQDLLDVLVSYFRQGLLDNETCLWITSGPREMEEARAALRSGVPDLDQRIRQGQIEIVDYRQWYFVDGRLDCRHVLAGCMKREQAALDRGYAGLRLAGDTAWLEEGDWRSFTDCEAALDRAIGSHRMIALCAYSIDQCGALELIDIVRNHQFALTRQDGKCELIQSKRAEQRIRRQNAVLEGINRIFREALACETEEQLGRACLAVAEVVTDSKCGFIGELNAQGRLDVVAVSDLGWAACRIGPAPDQRKPPPSVPVRGIYGRVVQDGKSLFTNNPPSHPDSIGTPSGHPPMTAFLGVPLIHAGKTVGMVAVGNRDGGYRQEELEALESLAGAIVQVFMRHRAQRALNQQREWLRVTLTSIGDAVIATDTSGQVTFLNPVAADLTGWTRQEALGLPVSRVLQTIDETTRRPAADVVAQVLREKRTIAMANHIVLLARDGREIPIEDSAAPILDAAGNITGVVLVFHDVSEKRRAEDALRLSNERFRALFEGAADGIFIADSTGRYVDVNARGVEMLGYSRQEILARGIADIVAEHERARVPGEVAAVLSGRPQVSEWQFVRKDGSILPGEVSSQLLPDGRVIGILRDITERKLAEESIRQSEERLTRAQQIAHLGDWELDLVNNRLSWSNEVYHIFGLRPQEFAATYEAFLQAIHPDDRAAVDAAYSSSVLEGRDTYEIEHRVVRKDNGQVRVIHEKCQHIRDASGVIVRSVGMVHDITERTRAEEELRHAKQIAEAASRAKDQFIAALSHELRTPLTPSLAAAGTMAKDPRLPEDVREDLAMIERNIGLEVALINDLLDVTRIANGKLSLNKAPVDLAHILREAADICGGDLIAKRQTLTIDMPGAPYPVEADAARLHQVFWNLIKNAIKFTPAGGRIAIRAKREGDSVRVAVSDNGIGIDRAILPRLFSAFEQGEEAPAFGGLGLGLAIAKGVVEAHGGRISVESAGRDMGATFTVALPVVRCQLPPTAPEPLPATGNSQLASHPLRILLVEDHPDTARVMTRLLTAEGHEVTTADCIRAALTAADGGPFDVLMSDLGLPDGTGHDLMRQLLAAGKRIKGIAISGYGAAADMQQSRDAGFAEHITKPVAFDALHRALLRIAASDDPTR